MDRENELSQERSMVVSARVNVVKLAELAIAIDEHGGYVRTMSGLINYCVEISYDTLKANRWISGHISNSENPLLLATDVLDEKRLLRRGMKERNDKKYRMARGLENLRNEGDDPSYANPTVYKILHNKHSVQPVKSPMSNKSEMDNMVKIYHELENKEMMDEAEVRAKAAIEAAKARADENGLIRAIPAQTNVFEAPTPSVRPKLGRPPKVVEPLNECQIVQSSEVPVSYEDRKKSPEMYDRWKRQEQMRMAAAVKSVGQQSDMPRKKTDAEIEADALRIAQKDRELAEMDMSAPKGSMNQVD